MRPGTPCLDAAVRTSDFAAAGFRADEPEMLQWTLALDPEAVRLLHATYSKVTARPSVDRKQLLDGIAEVA
jgi:hypothetical protein